MPTPNKRTPGREANQPAKTRSKKENVWDDEGTEEENPNSAFLAAMEVARSQTISQPKQSQAQAEEEEEEDTEEEPASRAHLVKHRKRRARKAEEKFDNVYERETYYIDRTYKPKLEDLIESSGKTKTVLMNEALEMLFSKYHVTFNK